MPDLNFQVIGAEPQCHAAEPMLLFQLRISESLPADAPPTPIHSIALRCQIRIEPARRHYEPRDRERLLDLFGTPERWGQTLRPMLWTHASILVPAFNGTGQTELPVPCSFDFNLAATKYFDALQGGDLPLSFLFSGTIFHESAEQTLQVAPIPWDKEAAFRLPVAAWRGLIDRYYPNTAWLQLHKDVFDRLSLYKSRAGLPTWEDAMERLLAAAEEPMTP